MIDEERWGKICSRSEIASIPKTEGERKCAVVHSCPKCKGEFFCLSLMIPGESECKCPKDLYCYVCFNED